MKHVLMSLALGLFIISASVHAQEGASTSRLAKQHKLSAFQKEHMKHTEESIYAAIVGESVAGQQTAIQTLREMEQIVPDYPFSSLVIPLTDKLKDGKADPIVRKLAALALDELHSDAGDAAIKGVALNCDDAGLQSLCQALQVRTNNR
jgi:hypothetical protein